MAARTANEKQDDTDLRVDVGIIKSQLDDVKNGVGRLEKKIDNNSYVHESKYVSDRKDDKATYATKEEVKPIKQMFYAIITTIILGLITAFMTFVVKGGIR